MKRTRLMLLAAGTLAAATLPTAAHAQTKILMSGSTSVHPLTVELIKAYKKSNPKTKFSVSQGGSDIGIADVGGIIAYTLGTQGGNVSITTAVSASFILIPVVGGLVFFKERPAASQLVGVALVGGGLVLLGL